MVTFILYVNEFCDCTATYLIILYIVEKHSKKQWTVLSYKLWAF